MIEENTTTERIDYAELARRVGDMVLNNYVRQRSEDIDDWELFNGEDNYCYVHEIKTECQNNDHECEYESTEIYQDYIITQGGAEYLERNTNEIVFYNEKLNMYIWGVTHFGTSWDGVETDIIK